VTKKRLVAEAKPVRLASATRKAILKAATTVFAKHGYDAGSIDKITRSAKTHDRMIYYYFGSKEKLFIAVLEAAYEHMAEAERALALDVTTPVDALKLFIDFVWRYYQNHPEFISLLNAENMQQGKHIAKSLHAREYSLIGISLLDSVLSSGVAQGVFRVEIAARDVYLLMASMGYFYLSNRYTLSTFLAESTQTPAALAGWHEFMNQTVLRAVIAPNVVMQTQKTSKLPSTPPRKHPQKNIVTKDHRGH
jgi:TetR/AcrR family transcriptional regulator, upper aerobic nicotinate degradation pathway regulator